MKRKELRGRTKINRQWRAAHRSRDAPWPPAPSVGPDGHIAAVYPGSPKPRDSPGADSHCVRSAPIVYANVCSDTGDKRKDTEYQEPHHTELHHHITKLYFSPTHKFSYHSQWKLSYVQKLKRNWKVNVKMSLSLALTHPSELHICADITVQTEADIPNVMPHFFSFHWILQEDSISHRLWWLELLCRIKMQFYRQNLDRKKMGKSLAWSVSRPTNTTFHTVSFLFCHNWVRVSKITI